MCNQLVGRWMSIILLIERHCPSHARYHSILGIRKVIDSTGCAYAHFGNAINTCSHLTLPFLVQASISDSYLLKAIIDMLAYDQLTSHIHLARLGRDHVFDHFFLMAFGYVGCSQ